MDQPVATARGSDTVAAPCFAASWEALRTHLSSAERSTQEDFSARALR